MEPIILDLSLRGASTGILLLLACAIWVARITREAKLAFTLTAFTLSCRVWSTLPPGFALAQQTNDLLRLLGTGAAFFGTWLIIIIFLDNRRFLPIWLVSAACVSLGIVTTIHFPVIIPYLRAFAVLHFSALVVLIVASARGDLMNARRRIRPGLCVLLLLFSINNALTSTPILGEASVYSALSKTIPLIVVVFLFAFWSLKANVNNWPGEVTPRDASQPTLKQTSTAQNMLISRIQDAMSDGIWRNEGLTISALAQKVNAPEHRVRTAINQVLGHRNFSSFINAARIDEAKRRLRAPEDVDVTVLEIAYSVGFSSLGPFNRAFREATQQSPTEYRNLA